MAEHKKRKKSETLVASVAAFDEEGRLLFGLRSDAQKWTLPGGHLEEDEEPLRGAVRELREEAGLKPLSMEFLGVGLVRRDAGDIRVFCFKATVTGTPSGEDDPDQECQTWRFVDVKDGLPKDIGDNLFNRNNITLRLLGLQEGEVRKHEQKLAKSVYDDPEENRREKHAADYFYGNPHPEFSDRDLWHRTLRTDEREREWRGYLQKLGRETASANPEAVPPGVPAYYAAFWNKPEAGVVNDNFKAEYWGRHLHVVPDYDQPPPFLDARYREFIANAWNTHISTERVRKEMWDKEFRKEQDLVRRYGLEKYLSPPDTYRNNAYDPENNWATKAPWGRVEHLEQQEYLDSRLPDEDDVSFALRHYDHDSRALALSLPGVQPHHIESVTKNPVLRKELAHKIIDHPKASSKALGDILVDPSVNVVHRVAALKHAHFGPRTLQPEDMERFVRLIEEDAKNMKGDRFGPTPRQNADTRIIESPHFIQHPSLRPDHISRLVSPDAEGQIPLRTSEVEKLFGLRPTAASPDLLHDIVARSLDGEGASLYRHEYNLAKYALSHPNISRKTIDAVLAKGPDAYTGIDEKRRGVQDGLEDALVRRDDLAPEHITQILDWSKRHGGNRDAAQHRITAGNRRDVLKHKNVTVEHLDMAVNDPSEIVRERVPEHPLVQEHHIQRLFDHDVESWPAIARSEKVSPEMLDSFIVQLGDKNPSHENPAFADAISQNKKLTSQSIARIAANPKWSPYWRHIADLPNTQAEHIVSMLNGVGAMPYGGATTFNRVLSGSNPEMDAENKQWWDHPDVAATAKNIPGLDDELRSHFYTRGKPVTSEELHQVLTDLGPTRKGNYTRQMAIDHGNVSADTARALLFDTRYHSDDNQDIIRSAFKHPELSTQDLHNAWTTVARNGTVLPRHTIPEIFRHGNADDALRRELLTAGPSEDIEDMLLHGDHDKIAPYLEHLSYHQDPHLRGLAMSHPRTPAEISERGARDPHASVRSKSIGSGKLSKETLQRIMAEDPEKHIRDQAQRALAMESPDLTFSERVGVKLGTQKFRKIRDLILSKGKDRMHPKELPPGDWSAGRGPDGNIHAQKLQEHIEKLEHVGHFNVSHDFWTGAQRHSMENSKVLQVNLTDDHIKKMKEAGVYETFKNMQEASVRSGHPVSETHGIGWIRYTQSSDPVGECETCDGKGTYRAMGETECGSCEGTGREPGSRAACGDCGGAGENDEGETCETCQGDGLQADDEGSECGNCAGSGAVEDEQDEECYDCSGTGQSGMKGVKAPVLPRSDNYCATCNEHEGHTHHKIPPHEFVGDDGWCRATGVRGSPDLICGHQKADHDNYHEFKAKPPVSKPDEFMIDEVQSDFGQSFVRQAAAQARDNGHDEEEAVKRAEAKWPEQHFKLISKILFNGKHPNEILAEAAHQYLRDKGHHEAVVHWHTVESKAPISLGRKLSPLCGTCNKPKDHEHHNEEDVCGHCGAGEDGHEGSATQDHVFVPGEDPRWCAHPRPALCGIGRTAHEDKDHEFLQGSHPHCCEHPIGGTQPCDSNATGHLHPKATGHTFVPSGKVHEYVEGKEVNRLEAPGHFNVTYHDVPKKLGMEPSTYGKLKTQSGNEHDHDIGEGAPTWEGKVRKFEDNLSIWLAQLQPLAKMAVKPDDLKPISKYHDDVGEKFVDHSKEHDQHPGEHESYVSAFKRNVIDSPDIVKRGKTGTSTASNSTGKVVYHVDDEWMNGQRDHRFMVKPYHEKIVDRLKKWCSFPIQGWAEMTNQSLYHAAGIGDLHQKVHVAEVPLKAVAKGLKRRNFSSWHKEFWTPERNRQQMDALIHGKQYGAEHSRAELGDMYSKFLDGKIAEVDRHNASINAGTPTDAKKAPVLVVHMQPGVGGGRGLYGIRDLDEDTRQQSKKIALMDFLSNNLDRHGDNLLWDGTNQQFLAIDHSRSFQYRAADKGFEANSNRETMDSLHNYLHNSAHKIVDPQMRYGEKMTDARHRVIQEWNPVFKWWEKQAPAIRDTMHKRLDLIKDSGVREHIRRNFEERWNHLNQYVEVGHENFGFHDWERAPVSILRYGTNDHER